MYAIFENSFEMYLQVGCVFLDQLQWYVIKCIDLWTIHPAMFKNILKLDTNTYFFNQNDVDNLQKMYDKNSKNSEL